MIVYDFEDKLPVDSQHSLLEESLLQPHWWWFCDGAGLMTELSSMESIRNNNLIELRELSMRRQLQVVVVFCQRRQFCWFCEPRVLLLPCQVLCWLLSCGQPLVQGGEIMAEHAEPSDSKALTSLICVLVFEGDWEWSIYLPMTTNEVSWIWLKIELAFCKMQMGVLVGWQCWEGWGCGWRLNWQRRAGAGSGKVEKVWRWHGPSCWD